MLTPVTFGVGLPAGRVPVCPAPLTLLNHTLSAGSDLGVLSHFWATGDVDANVLVEVYIDGEAAPSLAFEPSLACGQGFPAAISADPISPGGLYSAGAKMGKSGAVGGWWLKAKVPFQASLAVTIRQIADTGSCTYAYILLRGHEVAPGDAGVVLSSGLALPRAARLSLQKIENAVFPALSLVSVANVSKGLAAVLWLSTVSLSTRPAGNNYIEGCWHLLRAANESFPGLVVGTGFEDFYSSSYWFGAASGFPGGLLFATPESGLLHFSRGPAAGGPAGFEQLSAYRFLDEEVFGMVDGGRLLWRVGDEAAKCESNGTEAIIGTPSAVSVTAYTWLYSWPNGVGPVIPLPPLPQPQSISYACNAQAQCVLVPNASGPFLYADCLDSCTLPPPPPPVPGPPAVVGCASGECDAFCAASKTVHGCLATWPGSVSMRAPATGIPCGGRLGPCLASPSDACAPGWVVCLGNNATQAASGVPAFRRGISASDCANGDPRIFVGAMSHARGAWEGLPPAPCPVSPQDDDNGCALPGTWGSEPVCCGAGCVPPSCPNMVWTAQTRIHVGESMACGGLGAAALSGVLCCKM